MTLGPPDARLAKMQDPEIRAALREAYDAGRGPIAGGGVEADGVVVGSGIAALVLEWTESDDPELKQYEGFTVGEIAEQRGVHPIDAMLDVVVADDLKAGFGTPPRETDVEVMSEIANSAFAIPGVSDGGAHTKFITLGAYPTEFLAHWVRDKGIMDLEQAHWRLSAYPAQAAGFKDRGWIKEGAPADIVIYDYDNLSLGESSRASDFPAGAWRLIRKPEGYRWIMVNGEVTFSDGDGSGATPGQLLRHGQSV